MTTVLAMAATVTLIALNGLFVAAEFALIAAQRTRVEAAAARGDRGATAALAAMRDLPLSLSGAQLGITVTSLGLGIVAEPALAHLIEAAIDPVGHLPSGVLHGVSFGVALFIVVLLHMVLGEMVPKNFALAAADRTAIAVARPHRLFVRAFRPLIWTLNRSAALLLRPFGIEQVDELGTAHTAQELVTMLDASHTEGVIDEFRHSLLSGVLDFRARRVADAMIPWSQVDMVDRSATVTEASAVAANSGHSRLPVVTPERVLGFVHAKDLLRVGNDHLDEPLDMRLVRRMLVVPSDRALEDLLFAMQRNRIHVAVVRDGDETVGIITLEDILESIVGDIIDESDRIRRVERVR